MDDTDLKGFSGGFTSGGFGYLAPADFGKATRFRLDTPESSMLTFGEDIVGPLNILYGEDSATVGTDLLRAKGINVLTRFSTSGGLFLQVGGHAFYDGSVPDAQRDVTHDYGTTVEHVLTDNEWHHVTWMWDSANGVAKIFAQGKLLRSAMTAMHFSITPGGRLALGWNPHLHEEHCTPPACDTVVSPAVQGTEGFPGSMADVRVWPAVRTAVQVLADMMAPEDGSCVGCVVSFQFASGAFGTDSSGNNNHLTMVGISGPTQASLFWKIGSVQQTLHDRPISTYSSPVSSTV
jgi:hypothetical protein